MTAIRRVIYFSEDGIFDRLRDGDLINAGGTSNSTFTVGGRGLLFDDGSSTSGHHDNFLNLQTIYNASHDNQGNASIQLNTGKDFVIYDDNNSTVFFKVDSTSGAVTITGDLNVLGNSTIVNTNIQDSDHWQITPSNGNVTPLKIEPDSGVVPAVDLITVRKTNGGDPVFRIDKDGNAFLQATLITGTASISGNMSVNGTINNISITTLNSLVQNHLTYDGNAKHAATEISITPISSIPDAVNVQQALSSLATTVQNIHVTVSGPQGYEHVQNIASTTWVITHNYHTMRVQWSIYDSGFTSIMPDKVQIIDLDTIQVTFGAPQTGYAMLICF
ncbi:MAG: hypothetical protein QXN55_01785 [Candidatus Nitrosotenuis sp.]